MVETFPVRLVLPPPLVSEVQYPQVDRPIHRTAAEQVPVRLLPVHREGEEGPVLAVSVTPP